MLKKTFIYKITNLINNKLYIGKTCNKNPLSRWSRHLSVAKHKTITNHTYQLIHKAINKYGKENFSFETIEECDTEELGLIKEKFWIDFYKTNVYVHGSEFGYNLTEGGDGSSGFKHSQKSKDKMSEDRKGTRLGKDNTFFGKKHSNESLLKIGAAHKGKVIPITVIESRSKLTVKDVLEIRSEGEIYVFTRKGRSNRYKELAKQYNVSTNLIRLIIKKERWTNV